MKTYELKGNSRINLINNFDWTTQEFVKTVNNYVNAGMWPENNTTYIITGNNKQLLKSIQKIQDLSDIIKKRTIESLQKDNDPNSLTIKNESIITIPIIPIKSTINDYERLINHELTHIPQMHHYKQEISRIGFSFIENELRTVNKDYINILIDRFRTVIDDHIANSLYPGDKTDLVFSNKIITSQTITYPETVIKYPELEKLLTIDLSTLISIRYSFLSFKDRKTKLKEINPAKKINKTSTKLMNELSKMPFNTLTIKDYSKIIKSISKLISKGLGIHCEPDILAFLDINYEEHFYAIK